MKKYILILTGVAVLAGFGIWSQKGRVTKTVPENKPVVSEAYIRVRTVLEKDGKGGGTLRFLIEPVGGGAQTLSTFALEAMVNKELGVPVLNQGMVGAGWSFPLATAANKTVKLSGVYISTTAFVLSGEQEVVAVPVKNLGYDEIEVRLGDKNTMFLRKDATKLKYKYE